MSKKVSISMKPKAPAAALDAFVTAGEEPRASDHLANGKREGKATTRITLDLDRETHKRLKKKLADREQSAAAFLRELLARELQ
jgi:hypothetical protein